MRTASILLLILCLTAPLLADNPAAAVRIFVDGRCITLTGAPDTVRGALHQACVSLQPDDEVTPAPDAPVPDDGVIRVARITYEEKSLEIRVPYRTVVRPATSTTKPYHPTVTQEGRSGLKRVTYRARIVDGREAERTTIAEEVLREAVPEIVTSRKPLLLGSRGAYTGKRTLTVLATAYDPGPGSCGRYADGRTCNGKRAGYGVIAVDPKVIPLGAKIFVPGYGYGIAADVGRAIQGNRIDLGYNSRPGAFAWGKKWVTIQLID